LFLEIEHKKQNFVPLHTANKKHMKRTRAEELDLASVTPVGTKRLCGVESTSDASEAGDSTAASDHLLELLDLPDLVLYQLCTKYTPLLPACLLFVVGS
jgi:hypothetical protein